MSAFRYLTVGQVLLIHRSEIERKGGIVGLRDEGLLLSACAQPAQTFGDQDLYPALVSKAAALAYSLVRNHPFVDGNKRVGLLALRNLLRVSAADIADTQDEKAEVILAVAAGKMSRQRLEEWITSHLVPFQRKQRART